MFSCDKNFFIDALAHSIYLLNLTSRIVLL